MRKRLRRKLLDTKGDRFEAVRDPSRLFLDVARKSGQAVSGAALRGKRSFGMARPGGAADGRDPFGNSAKPLPLPLIQGFAIYWLLLKLVALFVGHPHADEAYYWLWGQHFQLSYFDHAPFHAWLQGLVSMVLGWNIFALRALSVLTTGLTLYLLYLWARRLAPGRWQYFFWLSVALYFSSPLMIFYTTIAIHDRVLTVLAMLSVHCFAWYFADWAEGRRHRVWPLYLAAFLLGLATLTKYNGALVGIGVGLAILVRRDLRPLLRNPHLWLAALLSVLMQAPVLYWNLLSGFASVRFHLVDRPDMFDLGQMSFRGTQALLIETLPVLSPFMVWPMLRFILARAGAGFGGVLHSLGKWVLLASTAVFVAISLSRYVLFYWNIVGYTVFFGLAAWFMRSRILIVLQLLYGFVFSTALLVHFAIYPIFPAPRSEQLFGWSEIAGEVREAEARYGAEFAAGPSWGTASKLAFALRRPDLPALTATTDAFDYWFDPAAFAGKDAIVLVEPDDSEQVPYVSGLFDSFEPVSEFEIGQWGRSLYRYRLYLGRNFRPSPS